MNTRWLMASSSVVMGALGIAFSFLPQEILSYAGIDASGIAPLFLQITGALYVAFAMLNWMARTNLIGGIYSRPVATGNAIHFFVGAAALLKGLRIVPRSPPLIIAAAIYSLFAISFAIVLFRHPLKKDDAQRN